MLQEFLIEHYIGGATGVDNAAIDGLFIDDDWSQGFPTEEDTHAVEDMGLDKEQTAKVVVGWQANQAAAQAKILAAKAYNWQLLNCEYAPNSTHACAGAPQTAPSRNQTNPRAQCTEWMRSTGCVAPSDKTCTGGKPCALSELALFFGFTRVQHHQPLVSPGVLPAYVWTKPLTPYTLVVQHESVRRQS